LGGVGVDMNYGSCIHIVVVIQVRRLCWSARYEMFFLDEHFHESVGKGLGE
jgi:uncharacterized membrane protein